MKKRSGRLAQRGIQSVSLLLFIYLFFSASWPLAETPIPADAFLRMDPLVATLVPVIARDWIPALLPGLLVLASGLLFGRIFCGYLCPMGTTLDLAGGLLRAGKKRASQKNAADYNRFSRIKYIFLGILVGAAFIGVNLVFWGSPIALVTRLYTILLHPVLLLAGDSLLSVAQPFFEDLPLPDMQYLSVTLRRYSTIYFVLLFFGALFALEKLRPRFWCRYLCPAGALLGLASRLPFWRRRVNACTECGHCARHCPTGAIAENGRAAQHSECLACRTCSDVCPGSAAYFSFSAAPEESLPETRPQENDKAGVPPQSALPSRRAFISAAATGILLGAVQQSSLYALLQTPSRGLIWPESLIRPPGAGPEPDFLGRCIRCGECMKACPTNALQPVWTTAGLDAVFSPVLVARRGPCEPDCNVCGNVCPTGAIAPLPLAEKHWAKIGTATVLQERCLAWAESRSCMVCQEVCPYASVKVVLVSGAKVPVPVVDASRCFGCGYCEHHCPVRIPAIVVQPLNALRLADGSYAQTAKEMGLSLQPGLYHAPPPLVPEGELPPGFSE